MPLFVSDNSVWLSGVGAAPWRMTDGFVDGWLDQLQHDADNGDHAARDLFHKLYEAQRHAMGDLFIERVNPPRRGPVLVSDNTPANPTEHVRRMLQSCPEVGGEPPHAA